MKLGKLSLVAVMALGTSAFAIDNVKVSGEAKVWYQTSEYSGVAATLADGEPLIAGVQPQSDQDAFDNGANSMALVALKLGATADLLQNLSAGVKVTAISTLGLENNLVGATSAAKTGIDGVNHQGIALGNDLASLNDQAWVEELYLAYTMGKTTVKIGRQALSTPLAFTETWNVVDNTFEAAVLLNNDVKDTTLVAAWVGKHNGVGMITGGGLGTGRGSTVSYNGEFGTFATDGAYAAGAINKSIPNTTAQAWYYNVANVADAYWLQADAKLMDIINVGVQYSNMDPKNGLTNSLGLLSTQLESTDMYAVKAAVDVAGVNVYAAYSSVDSGLLGFANVATGDKSSVYTSLGSIYMDGEFVAAPDTDAWKIGASTKMVPGVTLAASYCEADQGKNGQFNRAEVDFSAWDVTANTKVGPVDLTAIYTQFSKDVKVDVATTNGDKDTDTLRIIASLKF